MALQMQTFTNVTEPMFDALIVKIKADTGQDIAATAVIHESEFYDTYLCKTQLNQNVSAM